MSIEVGSYVRVGGVAYKVPAAATRESMELALIPLDKEGIKPEVVAKKKKYARSAKGEVAVNLIGRVLAIKDGLVVLEATTTKAIEHALPDDCSPVKICEYCKRREAEIHESCKNKECLKKATLARKAGHVR